MKTRPKPSNSVIGNESFRLVFAKTVSIISGTGPRTDLKHWIIHLTFPNFEHEPLKGKVSGLYTVNSTFQYFLGMNIIYAEKLHKQYKGALTILLGVLATGECKRHLIRVRKELHFFAVVGTVLAILNLPFLSSQLYSKNGHLHPSLLVPQ